MPAARRGAKRGPAGAGASRETGGKPVKPRPRAADDSGGTRSGGFELAELRRLIELVQQTGIGEIEVTNGGRTVRIAAQAGSVPVATMTADVTAEGAPVPATAPAGPPPAAGQAAAPLAIVSPMVGTFYRAPAPDADPYVEVGDTVSVGQTVCIVEAMKLMNEIESEVKGRVVKILVENAQPVEYGQKLFLVEP
ncbi:MAG: acetyl-CoA carboxylase biotin carboxyl carrier protein [Candidatus Eiseniibacteriota bacterium]